MESLVSTKNQIDDFIVEFDVQPLFDTDELLDERKRRIYEGLASVDEQLEVINAKIEQLNKEIDRLTNHADGLDYAVAVGSGIIAGLVDVIFVGEFSFDKANEVGNDKVNNFVVKMAQSQGYKGDDLPGAIKFLEKKYPIAADKATNSFGGGLQHHIRDFSHHPTPVGLFFSMLTQFTHKVYGTDTAGVFHIYELKEGELTLIGNNLQEKITFGLINWFFHMVSDMAGSSSSVEAGKIGTGLPGPILSLLKELSALPIFKSTNADGNKELSVWISKLFNGTLLGGRDENGKLIKQKFDLRTEIGALEHLGKQAIPVIINECIVRGFYFIRRFYIEIKSNNIKSIKDLKNINWNNTLPFKNRTVIRMLTISTGTMTAIDLADAAINSAVKSGGVGPAFVGNMLLRVNFVGVGRFAVAIGTDVGMGVKKSKAQKERTRVINSQLQYMNAKVFYKEANMWISAEEAGETIDCAYQAMQRASEIIVESFIEIEADMKEIEKIFLR